MSEVVCKKCREHFETSGNRAPKGAAVAVGAVGGGWIGSHVGLAGGPIGAIAATIPGAAIGGILAATGMSPVVKCPHCGKVFRV